MSISSPTCVFIPLFTGVHTQTPRIYPQSEHRRGRRAGRWVREASLELQPLAEEENQTQGGVAGLSASDCPEVARPKEDPKDKNLRFVEAQGCHMHCESITLNAFEQKKCRWIFHRGKTLARGGSLGRLSVRQSLDSTSCRPEYGPVGTSCRGAARLNELNLTVSKGTCKTNLFRGAGDET